jgi:Domain of unknown function (DUF1707)/Cell wall-active antibiotics response 4TMS YvqF
MPDEPGAPGEINASDAERDAACERLREAGGEGRLTFEELADRIEAALGARTRGELARLTRDLPPATELATVPAGSELATPPGVASTVFGDLKRAGLWRVPAYSSWSTVFGDVKLDLREAHIERSPVTIHTRAIFGDIEVLVPEGVAVDLRVASLFGTVKQLADAADPSAPRVVGTGRTIFGDVRVLHQRLRERLADRLLGPRGGAA